jgi:hypothetical protein
MNADNTDVNSLSENVLGAVFEVSNTLGAGLRKLALSFLDALFATASSQAPVRVRPRAPVCAPV